MTKEFKDVSLEQMVYNALEEEILSGELKRGTPLTEIALSNRLGVSRTPVRGALHRLSEEGLVEITPNKGAVVVGINIGDLVDIYKIRMRLEGLASMSAAERISSSELSRLRNSVELSEFYISKNDVESLKELDTEFHKIIYAASGNRMLAKTLTELHNKIKSYRKISLTVSGRLAETVKEHKEILSAIEAGDGNLADELTLRHIERALENIVSQNKEL